MSPRQTMSLGDTLLQLLFRFIINTVYGALLLLLLLLLLYLLGLVHTFRFSADRHVKIIAGQSSGTQENKRLFTQPGRLAGWLPCSN